MPEVDGRGHSVFHRQGKGQPSLGEEGIKRPFQGANGDKIGLTFGDDGMERTSSRAEGEGRPSQEMQGRQRPCPR